MKLTTPMGIRMRRSTHIFDRDRSRKAETRQRWGSVYESPVCRSRGRGQTLLERISLVPIR
jgi:hypothetical protein